MYIQYDLIRFLRQEVRKYKKRKIRSRPISRIYLVRY